MTSSENIAAKTLEGKTTIQEECWVALGRGLHKWEVLLLTLQPLCGRGEALGESGHRQWVCDTKNELIPICSPVYQIYKLIEVLNLGPDIYSSQTSEPSEIKESVLIIMKAVTHVLNLQWRLFT